ncbi:hypothetical protein ES703_54076 [subsurface metagenome]
MYRYCSYLCGLHVDNLWITLSRADIDRSTVEEYISPEISTLDMLLFASGKKIAELS